MSGIWLWVDDARNPESFRPGEQWHWAKTVTAAIRILATMEVERVALDHDIMHPLPGTEHMAIVKPFVCGETFEAVARYIALMPNPPEVSIHTGNPAGESKMRDILADGERRRAENR